MERVSLRVILIQAKNCSMKNMERFMEFFVWAVSLIGIFYLVDYSFGLMSRRSTISNLGGLLLLITVSFFVTFFIINKIRRK